MRIKLEQKFTEKNIDRFIHNIYSNFKTNPKDQYIFDLTEVEYIGNQELLIFSAILKVFVTLNVDFNVVFFRPGISTNEINDRVKRQIIQIWEVWKIWQIIPNQDYLKFFGLDGNSVERLEKELNYFPKVSEIYNRHGVTPFVELDYINNYNENEIQEIIEPIYELNSAISDLLKADKCHHPFTSQSLSTIITEELYLNFLDYSELSSFAAGKNQAFFKHFVSREIALLAASHRLVSISD